MNKIEHISHKNHHYEMIAYFQNDVLTISLKELSSKDPNTFFQTLKDSTLPDDLKNHLEST